MRVAAINLAAVAAGGALGASMRYLLAAATHSALGHDFPYGTLMVNVVGSLLIGYLMVLLPVQEGGIPVVRLLLITGLLGGFTTYSAFSVETLQLVQDGHLLKAGLNISMTFFFCFIAVWGGFVTARLIHVPS
jgi:CrcB protein